MKNTTKEILNFKLAMADELLTILDNKEEQLEGILQDSKSYQGIDCTFLEHSKYMLNRISFYKAILNCTNEDEFFYLTSGKPKVKEVI
jgi:ABC-type oligopeptide transport system ATPase subunit